MPRPKLPENEKKSKIVGIAISKEWYDLLAEKAKEHNLSISSFLREYVLKQYIQGEMHGHSER